MFNTKLQRLSFCDPCFEDIVGASCFPFLFGSGVIPIPSHNYPDPYHHPNLFLNSNTFREGIIRGVVQGGIFHGGKLSRKEFSGHVWFRCSCRCSIHSCKVMACFVSVDWFLDFLLTYLFFFLLTWQTICHPLFLPITILLSCLLFIMLSNLLTGWDEAFNIPHRPGCEYSQKETFSLPHGWARNPGKPRFTIQPTQAGLFYTISFHPPLPLTPGLSGRGWHLLKDSHFHFCLYLY